MKKSGLRWMLALALLFLLWHCAPTRYVIRDGQQIKLSQAIEIDAARARDDMQAGRKAEGLRRWNQFLQEYPDNRFTGEALFHLGKNHFDRKEYKQAEPLFNKVISDTPRSPFVDPAKVLLGTMMTKRGDHHGSFSLLDSVKVKRLQEPLKKLHYAIQRKNAGQLDQPLTLVISSGHLYALLSEQAKRDLLRQEIIKLIESVLQDDELKKVQREFDDQFPADLALMRLGLRAYDRRELERAADHFRAFSRKFPEHTDVFRATTILDEIKQRKIVDNNKIGVLVPLSGENARYGERIVEGIQFAAGIFDSQSRPGDGLQFVVRDTETSPARTQQAIEELVLREHVIAMIGPLFQKTSAVAAQRAEHFGVPLITFAGGESLADSSPYVFRNSISKSRQARATAKAAIELLGITNFAILYPDHTYGVEMARLFYREIMRYPHARLRAAVSYKADQRDFGKEIKRLGGLQPSAFRSEEICPPKTTAQYRQQNGCYPADQLPPQVDFEAVFIPDGIKALNQIAGFLFYDDITGIQLLGPNLWNSTHLFDANNQRYFQGAIFPGLDLQGAEQAALRKQFQQSFGKSPDIFHALAIDATRLLVRALIDRGAKDRDRLSQVMADPGFSVAGVSGDFAFNQQGEAIGELNLFIVDGKQILPISGQQVAPEQ